MMGFFKKKPSKKERTEQRRILELEVEKQGVLAVASRLETATEQREFINDYWAGKDGHEDLTINRNGENDNEKE